MKCLKIIIMLVFIWALGCCVYGSTVITTPIDSRPVSTDYLGKLAEINGDTLIYSHKENLDYFSAVEEDNYIGKSKNVRKELEERVSENNNDDTVVIINTPSYFTNGLVGSRCGVNYNDYQNAADDLKKLVTQYKEPLYYVNICMPRTLPETRFNKIWPYDNAPKGLAYYYLKYNPDSPFKDDIKTKYVNGETPSQFLLEYGYVESKLSELGKEKLTQWEVEFIEDIHKNCGKKFPFRAYLASYRKPFESVADIFDRVANLKKRNLIDEIIISNDDFQLPDFIIFMAASDDNEWIGFENGSAIKYSFARKYMTAYVNSIQAQVAAKFGKKEAALALQGKSDFVNFIFGTDEVPQLVYARSVSHKSGITGDLVPVIMGENEEVAKFDVLGPKELLYNDIAFVSHSNVKTDEKTYIFMYNYNNHNEKLLNDTISQMKEKIENGSSIGLIEIYSSDVYNTGNNALFKTLVSGEKGIKITDLSMYSAWNTNGNAIGLGTAHAQVYSIASQTRDDSKEFLTSNINMLAEHLLEDGIYTCNTKRELQNERYIPVKDDLIKSEKLLAQLKPEWVLDAVNGAEVSHKGNKFVINNCSLDEYTFPWGRTFECYLKINTDLGKLS